MIEAFTSIDRFAWPWAFAALALLPLLVLIWSRRASRPSAIYSATRIARAGSPSLRARLAWLPALLRLICLALLITALARPQSSDDRTRQTTEGVALQLVLDRSGSMEDEQTIIDGQRVERLEAAKSVLAEFIGGNGDDLKGRDGDLLGLIAFASYADTITPLSREHDTLLELLADIDAPQIREERGTAIGDALALAAARLKRAEDELARKQAERGEDDFQLKGKAIVLLTDGENTAGTEDPRAAAALAKDLGVRVYCIGIRGGVQRGFMRTQQIDEGLLTDIAEATGGRFWAVDSGDRLREIYAEIDTLERTTIQLDEMTDYRERFTPWLAGALACLCLEVLLGATWLRRLP
jgi:Ca-activated chloride channel family protein